VIALNRKLCHRRRINAGGALACGLALPLGFFASRVIALTTDQQQVIQVTVSAVQARFPSSTATASVSQIAIVGNYALTTWLLGEAGGQAVLKRSNKGTWSILGIGGSQMGSGILVAFGVPSATASSLESDLGPVPTPMP